MKKTEISSNSIVQQMDNIVASEIDGETVMMSIDSGSYYGLDPIGSRIWALVENPMKVADLINVLTNEYDVDQETCEKDVFLFLNGLHNGKILRVEY